MQLALNAVSKESLISGVCRSTGRLVSKVVVVWCMSSSNDGDDFPFEHAAVRLRSKRDLADLTLSRKIQAALEEPENTATKDLQLSGERIGRLMGRKAVSGSH